MAGRKPKPASIKKAEGNRGKRKKKVTAEPKGKFGAPPKDLNSAATKLWKELAPRLENRELSAREYRPALEGLCVNLARARECETLLESEGLTFETEKGYIGQHPAVAISIKCWSLSRLYLAEFGLTPSAAARVPVAPADPGDDLETYLNSK